MLIHSLEYFFNLLTGDDEIFRHTRKITAMGMMTFFVMKILKLMCASH